MTNDSKLKKLLREEIDNVTKQLVQCEEQSTQQYLKSWLQSLQRIDDLCKERNRY